MYGTPDLRGMAFVVLTLWSFLYGFAAGTSLITLDADGAQLNEPTNHEGRWHRLHSAQLLTDANIRMVHKEALTWSRHRASCSPEQMRATAGIPICLDPTFGPSAGAILPLHRLLHSELSQLAHQSFCGIDPTDTNRVGMTGAYCSEGMDNADPADEGLAEGLVTLFGSSRVLDLGAGCGID